MLPSCFRRHAVALTVLLSTAASGALGAPPPGKGPLGTIATPVSQDAVCTTASASDLPSSMNFTLFSSAPRTLDLTLFSQNMRMGYWMTTVTLAPNETLIGGFGYEVAIDISGGLFLRSTTTVGSLPRGTSVVNVVARRTDGYPDPGVPVLETCAASITVNAR